MHETDAFRKECRTEVVAKWWLPHTMYFADYQRDGRWCVYCDGVPIAYSLKATLKQAVRWAKENGYMRLGDAP